MRLKRNRLRDKAYLRHVREYACLACGLEHHSIAHHVQYAQGSKAMALKTGDEWAVPLCTPCHTSLHKMQERLWWALRGIDPLEWCRNARASYETKR